MVKDFVLTKDRFEKKELAEQKGGLWEYYEYSEGIKKIVIRFYGSTKALAVDFYMGIDMTDADNAENIPDGAEWETALQIANRFFKQYDFSGPQE